MAEHLPEHTQDTTDEDSLTEPPEYDENGQANGFVDDIHIATVEEKKRRWWRNALINSLFIGSWFVFAMVLSLYNKWMFSPEHFGFPFPLFVTTMHIGSALGGLRWSLTQLLIKDKKMGLDNPVSTIFWLSPIMGLSVAIISAVLDRWSELVGSRFFDSAGASFKTCFLLTIPGALAFCMILSEYSIIQRAGVIPMSIAGIAKEVSTITLAAWFFGDELTPLNITGVAITTCGIVLFTYHKYRKSIDSQLPLDAHGNPIEEDLDGRAVHHMHVLDDEERRPLATATESRYNGSVEQERPAEDSPLFKVDSDSDVEEDMLTSRTSSPGHTHHTLSLHAEDFERSM
ncbi:hypothetical protein EW026_g5607 [Hermanssonia centrifuga]|uniref:GDP-mannose transporter n=1 Tax=Hermanssonia centrifuga TaxID=98765 RepID=A0A4S4KDJ4_9APHY|nr:hypothetical protein EW026_g5607 [Hermanssonia centrifuga]